MGLIFPLGYWVTSYFADWRRNFRGNGIEKEKPESIEVTDPG
jgi:hypothetical protein